MIDGSSNPTAVREPAAGRKEPEENESAAGSLGLALGFIYATGLAVNNLFLAQYGLSDFSIVKPKAIFTGAIVLGSLALIAAGPMHFLSRFIDYNDAKKEAKRAGGKPEILWPYPRPTATIFVLLKILLPLFAVILTFLFAASAAGPPHPTMTWPMIIWKTMANDCIGLFGRSLIVFLSSCAVPICAIEGLRAFRNLASANNFPGMASRLSRTSLFLTGSLTALAVYISIFVTSLYVYVPGSVGGPGLEPVELQVSEGSQPELKALGIQFNETQPTITKPIRVLLENDDTVFVMIPYDNPVMSKPLSSTISPLGLTQRTIRVLRIERKILGKSIILRTDEVQ